MIAENYCWLFMTFVLLSSAAARRQNNKGIFHHQQHSHSHQQRDLHQFEGDERDHFHAPCGTVEPSDEERIRANEYLVEHITRRKLSSSDSDSEEDEVEIDIKINTHVFVVSDGSRGRLSEDEVYDSLHHLNDVFNEFGMGFQVRSLTYADNDDWFDSDPNDEDEEDMKRNLRKGDATTLNIYFKRYTGGASYPWNYNCDPALDGVVVGYKTIPGGSDEAYDEGDTLVHQVGHWLGLFHVFRYSCDPGMSDKVSDTPIQKLPTYGCPSSDSDDAKDSCTGRAGDDNIHNYMDYSDDKCRDEFTPGQIERMKVFWNQRQGPPACESLGGGGICFSPKMKTNVLGKGAVLMEDLQAGDKVLTGDGDYNTVYTISHFHTSKKTHFLQIHTNLDRDPLELSANHMVFIPGREYPVPASTINLGDSIQSISGPRKVTEIKNVTRNGLYNPVTTDGTIVVNEMIASVYTSHYGNTHVKIAGINIIPVNFAIELASVPYCLYCMTGPIDRCNQHDELSGASLMLRQLYAIWSKQFEWVKFVTLGSFVLGFRITGLVLSFYFPIAVVVALLCFIVSKKK